MAQPPNNAQLDARLKKVEADLVIVKQDIATLKSETATLKADMAAQKTATGLLVDDVAALDERVTVLEGAAPPNPNPVPPEARFICTPDPADPLSCSFDGRSSLGDIKSYAWNLGYSAPGDDGTASGPVVSCRYPHGGEREIKLTVTDAAGVQDSDTMLIEVSETPPVEPPIPPEPLPGEGEPVFAPGDKMLFETVDTDSFYQPTTDDAGNPVSAVKHAGYAFITRRMAPYPSPVVNGDPVLEEEVEISNKQIVMKYRQLPGQTGPAHWMIGVDRAVLDALPLTALHVMEADLELTGTPGANAAKFARFRHSGGIIQWSSKGDCLPYLGSVPGGVPFQCYPNGYSDEVLPYPDGHDQGTQPRAPWWASLFNNGKHRFRWSVRGHSAAGVYDGLMQLHIDGRKVLDISAASVGVTPADGVKQWTGREMLKQIPVGIRPTEGFAFGGTQSTVNQPPWQIRVDINSAKWWVRV